MLVRTRGRGRSSLTPPRLLLSGMRFRVLILALATGAALYFFKAAAETSPASKNPLPPSSWTESLAVGGASINVEIEPGDLSLSRNRVLHWVRRSACAVTEYYEGFPVRNVDVQIVPIDGGQGVLSGRTVLIDQTLVIRVGLSRFASDSSLRDDWIMTHEMVHLALPSVAQDHHWIEEGIATYVEPIAREQVGDLSAEIVWKELVDGLPKGLPGPGDRGLDITHTWGRTYWGGALFCLMADLEIHRRTNNQYGLQDALRGIVRAGGNMEHDWPLTRVLKSGDDAVGVPVLTELYDEMKSTPMSPDLAAIWRELGVRASGDSVAFDQGAPEAAIVRSIMAARSSPTSGCEK
jgi:hypothetical protein